ncbi:SagB/ThcOx family dehydrogenase [Haloarculaceae archaeon H-GB11]|nr:SagB/ThcOx family dehydrogenase [Haloarculaceae archaeon H-GB11]
MFDRPSRRTVLTVAVTVVISVFLDLALGAISIVRTDGGGRWQATETVPLPNPSTDGNLSVAAAIEARRSRRSFGEDPLTRAELGQLLWSMQGITQRPTGHRAAPSAGALFPLELYVVVGDPGVEGLPSGVYRYRPSNHELRRGSTGNVQPALQRASVDQEHVGAGAIDVVVCAVDERTTGKYERRGERRYVPMEAGHTGQNLYLQAESLGLSTVAVGAFADDRVRDLVVAPADQRPLYVFPVGRRA